MSIQAEFAATLVDEWARAGVADAVVSPGSRSAPLTLALLRDGRIAVHVRLDERSGAFFALGVARSSRRPVVVVTTSGTAAAEVHAAVLEADRGGVPLIVCTADRPHELHGVGAQQTVEQGDLFGAALRYRCAPGVAEAASRSGWRAMASRLVIEASGGPTGPGPVHANLAFREPLTGVPAGLPPGRGRARPWHELVRGPSSSAAASARLVELVDNVERGLIVAGAGAAGEDPEDGTGAILELARKLGWPVLAEPRAWPRRPGGDSVLVAAADQILRGAPARRALAPELVLHLGSIPASKVLATFARELAESGTVHVHVAPYGRFEDPDRLADVVLVADPGALARDAAAQLSAEPGAGRSGSWARAWERAERAAQEAIDEVLEASEGLSEPFVARALSSVLPRGAALVASSSMPVRELEWFAALRDDPPVVFANRGASGIDGVVSSALGVAASHRGGPTVCLLGDLAFLYDLSGLLAGAAEERPSLTLVVIDNGGGGIFSFLPYASELDAALFERAFAAPQANEVARVAAGLGCTVHVLEDRFELARVLEGSYGEPGISVVVVTTDRASNVALHLELERAVAEAVEKALGI